VEKRNAESFDQSFLTKRLTGLGKSLPKHLCFFADLLIHNFGIDLCGANVFLA
jgi:hypothetical protein